MFSQNQMVPSPLPIFLLPGSVPSSYPNLKDQISIPSLTIVLLAIFLSSLRTERAASIQVVNHLTLHHLFPGTQSAYRKHHSTETALLKVTNDILLSMNRQHVSLLVLLDFSSAFDTVDRTILLNRLQSHFGICDSSLSWFESIPL